MASTSPPDCRRSPSPAASYVSGSIYDQIKGKLAVRRSDFLGRADGQEHRRSRSASIGCCSDRATAATWHAAALAHLVSDRCRLRPSCSWSWPAAASWPGSIPWQHLPRPTSELRELPARRPRSRSCPSTISSDNSRGGVLRRRPDRRSDHRSSPRSPVCSSSPATRRSPTRTSRSRCGDVGRSSASATCSRAASAGAVTRSASTPS